MIAAVTAGGANTQVILTALAVISLMASGLVFAVKGFREAQAANAAVNNTGPGEHRLYDKISLIQEGVAEMRGEVGRLVKAQDDFESKGWANGLPSDMDTAPKLADTVHGMQYTDEMLRDQIEAAAVRNTEEHTRLYEVLKAHVEWEETEKYK